MKTSLDSESTTTVAAFVAGEDIACGDFVALHSATWEFPSYMWDQALVPPQELVRLKMIPSDTGEPFKVIGICLPFVYAKDSKGNVKTFDLRREQIVRLNSECAENVWHELKSAEKRKLKRLVD
jgi:hypothetical protein